MRSIYATHVQMNCVTGASLHPCYFGFEGMVFNHNNKISTETTAPMAADKEAVVLSRVHACTNLCVSCPHEVIVYSVLKHIYGPL